ncbi:hypothetical protein ACN28E_28890 [Archangium lansingense]|uniref:hypothetical protein n=1 Tax=Archangium lansingense TaxID=2995310 RepID=UPI003B7C4C84
MNSASPTRTGAKSVGNLAKSSASWPAPPQAASVRFRISEDWRGPGGWSRCAISRPPEGALVVHAPRSISATRANAPTRERHLSFEGE